MPLPQPANTTCDIYRQTNTPPAAPNVAGVACHLSSDFIRRLNTNEAGPETDFVFTHVMLVDLATDVRDGFNFWAYLASPDGPDHVYVPDKDGTPFRVVFVERHGRGTANDHKRVYLDREIPNWPTDHI